MSEHETDVRHLERLLRDRVIDVDPDLEARAADGVRAGARLRTRRRMWVTLTASAGVVAVIMVGAQSNVSLGSSTPPGFATDPTLGHSRGAGPSGPDCHKLASDGWKGSVPIPRSSGGPDSLDAKKRIARRLARSASQMRELAACKRQLRTAALASGDTEAEQLPVTLVAPGWTCGVPGDEKFTCHDGSAQVVVTVRPATERDAYLHDPDKASPDQYVSSVHGKVFAVLARAPGEHDVSVRVLGRHLVWREGH